MKIAVLGTGYVGRSTGVCFSEIGHHVTCIDINDQKISDLQQGISPIYEPGLENLLIKNITAGRLRFTTSHKDGINGAEILAKTLGGLQTNLDGNVLNAAGQEIPGLYAAGEVSGFGGGGVHGYRAMEGTFLGGCLFSGRQAGRAISRN